MAESLNLPPHVKPLWIEALFTSEYERDTLPLLFASDKVYQDYYASLRTKNPNLSLAIDQIRERNSLARMERQEGMWMECVDSLLYCTTLRRAVFDESDFQFTAAQKHHIMSLLNFATFFLRESSNAKTREAMLMRSYELFKKAEEAVAHVRGREDRYFLKTAIENNYAVYFAKRKKYCAAAQRITMALRAWTPLQIPEHQFYFAVQKSSGDLWSGRVDDAVIGLKHATMHVTKKKFETVTSPPRQRNDQDFSDDSDASSSDEDAVVVAPVRGGAGGAAPHAPFRYNIHVLNSGLDAGVASCIAVFHNLAIALIAQRRYKEAIGWITKSLEVVAAQSSQLVATHPIVVTVRHAEEFCQKMSMGTKMSTFKMKRDDHSSEQYRNMQAAVLKSREPQRLQADGSEGPVKKSPSPPSRARSAHCPRFRKPTHVEALQTYLKNVSYRQLVEEFGFEDPKVVHAKSPPSRGASQKASPARMARENSNAEHHDRDLTSANSESEASPARDQHSSASTSRRSSPRSSRASSRASSVEPADGPQAPPVEEAVTQPIVAATPVQTQGQPAAEDAPAKAQPLPGEATGPSTQAAVLAEESAVELPAESSSTAQGEPPAVETETAAQSSGPPVSKQSVVEPHAEPEQAPVQAEPPAAAEAEPPAAAEAEAPAAAEAEPPEATEAEAPAAAEAEPPAATEAEAPAATEAEAPAAAEAEPPAATEAEAPAAPQPPSIPPVEPEGHSGTDVAPPVAASSPQQKPSGDATYGDDDFESASEANSPVKVPRALNNTSEYANDFENTADSTFSPLAPRTEDAPTVETSAVEPPDAVAAEPPANVTYGEDEFEDDA